MKLLIGALVWAAAPLLVAAQPAPPNLSELPAPSAAAPVPEPSASAPQRRCVAGCDGKSARVVWSEDELNRFEEHRNERGDLVKFFVHPKSNAPSYEVLVRNETQGGRRVFNPMGSQIPQNVVRDGQAVWTIKAF